MMRYFAKYDENGRLIAVGCGNGGQAISKETYTELRAQIRRKAALTQQLCDGSITIADVPDEWQQELQARAEELLAAREAEAENEG